MTTRVCVPICERRWSDLEHSSRQAIEVADLIELRLDYLVPQELDLSTLDKHVRSLGLPVILTFRPTDQGGARDLSVSDRIEFWKAVVAGNVGDYWDIEADFIDQLLPDLELSKVITSYHDFNSLPHNLVEISETMSTKGAAVVKIAINTIDVTDCLTVFQLLDDYQKRGEGIIAIGMGNAGIATRILGPSRGSFLTYAALSSESASAPGQLTAAQLRSVYRVEHLSVDTPIFGLVGSAVMHSVSPHMHNAAFAQYDLPGVYMPFEVTDVDSFFRRMVNPKTRELNWSLQGLSITAPHKTAVIKHLDWISPEADEIGAVNTVVFDGDQLRGFNTDAAGFLEPLRQRVSTLAGLKVAILGAGGVVKSVAWALKREQAAVTIFARDVAKGRPLADQFDTSVRTIEGANFDEFDLVINATPLGSLGKFVDATPVTVEQLSGVRHAYDLIYNPTDTQFLQAARSAGCETIGGLEMLVAQAQLQFQLWTGKFPSPEIMMKAALSGIA